MEINSKQYILGYVGNERIYHTFDFLSHEDEIISQLDCAIDEQDALLFKQTEASYSLSQKSRTEEGSPTR